MFLYHDQKDCYKDIFGFSGLFFISMASLAFSLASYHGIKEYFLLYLFLPYSRKPIKGGNYSREETIQGRKLVSKKASKGRKLFKGGNYIRADTIQGNTVDTEKENH